MLPPFYFLLRGLRLTALTALTVRPRAAAGALRPALARLVLFLTGAAFFARTFRVAAAFFRGPARIFERRYVLRDLLAACNGPQQAPHDFSGPRFRQIVGETNVVGLGDGT